MITTLLKLQEQDVDDRDGSITFIHKKVIIEILNLNNRIVNDKVIDSKIQLNVDNRFYTRLAFIVSKACQVNEFASIIDLNASKSFSLKIIKNNSYCKISVYKERDALLFITLSLKELSQINLVLAQGMIKD